jgi:hypothetical protein
MGCCCCSVPEEKRKPTGTPYIHVTTNLGEGRTCNYDNHTSEQLAAIITGKKKCRNREHAFTYSRD